MDNMDNAFAAPHAVDDPLCMGGYPYGNLYYSFPPANIANLNHPINQEGKLGVHLPTNMTSCPHWLCSRPTSAVKHYANHQTLRRHIRKAHPNVHLAKHRPGPARTVDEVERRERQWDYNHSERGRRRRAQFMEERSADRWKKYVRVVKIGDIESRWLALMKNSSITASAKMALFNTFPPQVQEALGRPDQLGKKIRNVAPPRNAQVTILKDRIMAWMVRHRHLEVAGFDLDAELEGEERSEEESEEESEEGGGSGSGSGHVEQEGGVGDVQIGVLESSVSGDEEPMVVSGDEVAREVDELLQEI